MTWPLCKCDNSVFFVFLEKNNHLTLEQCITACELFSVQVCLKEVIKMEKGSKSELVTDHKIGIVFTTSVSIGNKKYNLNVNMRHSYVNWNVIQDVWDVPFIYENNVNSIHSLYLFSANFSSHCSHQSEFSRVAC